MIIIEARVSEDGGITYLAVKYTGNSQAHTMHAGCRFQIRYSPFVWFLKATFIQCNNNGTGKMKSPCSLASASQRSKYI